MQGGHHARLKAEVGGRIDKAKSTRDGHQTPGSERRGVEGTLVTGFRRNRSCGHRDSRVWLRT